MPTRQSLRGNRGRTADDLLPDLHLLDEVVSSKVLHALHVAVEQLEHVGVSYALIGGLAVGAHGYARATKDVDFLVDDNAFIVHGGGFITIAPGVPISVGNIAVDTLSIEPHETFLHEALREADVVDGIRILPIEALIYMKLKAYRHKDQTDVIELAKYGELPLARIRSYLLRHASALLPKFDALLTIADEEGTE